MSGGFFTYTQYHLDDAYRKLLDVLKNIQEDSSKYDFSDETLEEFKLGLALLRAASIYINRIDYLLSGDDSEESFHVRLADDSHTAAIDEQFQKAIK